MNIFKRLFRGQLPSEDALKLQASVSDSFKAWKQTDVGKYLIVKADHERTTLINQLLETDSYNCDQIMKLQERAKVLGDFLSWIQDAIEQGDLARFQLNDIKGNESGY